jgi:hypothetical protein
VVCYLLFCLHDVFSDRDVAQDLREEARFECYVKSYYYQMLLLIDTHTG